MPRKQQLAGLLARFDEITKQLDSHHAARDTLGKVINKKSAQLDDVVQQIQQLTNYKYFS